MKATRSTSFALVLSTVSAVTLTVGNASADTACINAYEQTQTLRHDRKFGAAKTQAAICARESCPQLLANDCAKWLAELEANMPSVVLDVRDRLGASVTDARVAIDGVELRSALARSEPIPLDPGAHSFRVEAPGAPAVVQNATVSEGVKGQVVSISVSRARAREEKRPEPMPTSRPVPVGAWIFGGAAVAAFATSAVFAIDGWSRQSDLDACQPRCAPSDVDAMSARFTVADVALGAGIMAAAAAAYVFFTRPHVVASTMTAQSR